MCHDHVAKNKIPAFGKTSIVDAFVGSGIASCLTATRDDFANIPHKDNDTSPYTFGMWLTTRNDGSLVLDAKECEDAVKGGQFFWGDWGVAADFGQCPGLVELVWRGKDDFHGTAVSETKPGYQRWGTSVQVSGRLEKRMVSGDLGKERVQDLPTRCQDWKFGHPDWDGGPTLDLKVPVGYSMIQEDCDKQLEVEALSGLS
jgi:hypothetical protein